ncbi:hypothetical protein Tco_1224333 [Tanacetum coccineum]
MSFGAQTVGGAVVSTFDIHVYTSVLTSNEVKILVAKYAIPLDLHPCVRPSSLTMNRLPVDKTVATSMSQFLKFLLARGVRVSKGAALTADEVIPQHTAQPFPSGAQIPEKSDHEKVVEYENERVLAAKRKAHAAKDKATKKRSAAKGTSRRTKKKKTDPLTFALDETEGDDSTRKDDVEHRLDDEGDGTEVNSLHAAYSFEPQPSNHSDEDTHVHSGRGGFYHDEGAELTRTGYSLKDKNKAKPDKTEHGFEKSAKN